MVIAVGYGSTSGCGNHAIYINRTESDGRHIRVVLGPDDTGQTVVPVSDSTARYYRTLMQVTLYDTTGGDQVRRAMEHWRATIVAGGPYPTPYILLQPYPSRRVPRLF